MKRIINVIKFEMNYDSYKSYERDVYRAGFISLILAFLLMLLMVPFKGCLVLWIVCVFIFMLVFWWFFILGIESLYLNNSIKRWQIISKKELCETVMPKIIKEGKSIVFYSYCFYYENIDLSFDNELESDFFEKRLICYDEISFEKETIRFDFTSSGKSCVVYEEYLYKVYEFNYFERRKKPLTRYIFYVKGVD